MIPATIPEKTYLKGKLAYLYFNYLFFNLFTNYYVLLSLKGYEHTGASYSKPIVDRERLTCFIINQGLDVHI